MNIKLVALRILEVVNTQTMDDYYVENSETLKIFTSDSRVFIWRGVE